MHYHNLYTTAPAVFLKGTLVTMTLTCHVQWWKTGKCGDNNPHLPNTWSQRDRSKQSSSLGFRYHISNYISNTEVDVESTSLRNLPSTEQSMWLCHYTHPALNDPGYTNGHCQGSFLKCLPQALSLANSFIISGEATATRTNAGKVPTARQKYTQCTLSVLDQYTEKLGHSKVWSPV